MSQLEVLGEKINEFIPDPKGVVGEREKSPTEDKKEVDKKDKTSLKKNPDYGKELGKAMGRGNPMVRSDDEEIVDFGN